MNIVIIEDEKPSARLLKRKTEQLGCSVITVLTSVEESIAWISTNMSPDLILADIQLADGLSFEIFEQINIQSALIFTTGYDEYALRAFKLNSIDDLLKLIDDTELKTAIELFSILQSHAFIDSGFIRRLLKKQYKIRYSVKACNLLDLLDAKEIYCFYSAF